jgi:hypothetical protein
MESQTYRGILKCVGGVLIVIGLIDIAVMIYCIVNRISYSSSFNIFAVIAGILSMRGGLKAAVAVLVAHQIVVVSGLAEGVDTAAHTAAIEAGGHTIAVLGTPLDQFYPKENRDLQERLMREQLVVSQFAQGSAVTPKNFPIRNRTMALLTDATVIVEAGAKSGTLHQGWEALRLGRLLFLTEDVVNDAALSWPKEIARFWDSRLCDR